MFVQGIRQLLVDSALYENSNNINDNNNDMDNNIIILIIMIKRIRIITVIESVILFVVGYIKVILARSTN